MIVWFLQFGVCEEVFKREGREPMPVPLWHKVSISFLLSILRLLAQLLPSWCQLCFTATLAPAFCCACCLLPYECLWPATAASARDGPRLLPWWLVWLSQSERECSTHLSELWGLLLACSKCSANMLCCFDIILMITVINLSSGQMPVIGASPCVGIQYFVTLFLFMKKFYISV